MRNVHVVSAAAMAALGLLAHGCADPGGGVATRAVVCEGGQGPVAFPVAAPAAPPAISVAAMDRAVLTKDHVVGAMSVDARFLVLTGDGTEPEYDAIRAALDHRGIPYDTFVATEEPPLTAGRLSEANNHGFYQATILSNSSLWVGDGSALDASEWGVLADYEARFRVRRASLNTWPDPAYGFGSISATSGPVTVSCTAAGRGVFRDVNCNAAQTIRDAYTYLATASGTRLVPLLSDASGRVLAATYTGTDGRESLLLMFSNNQYLPHSLTFLHGVIGWVSGGTYVGSRRIDMSAQVDDLFLASDLYGGGEYRMNSRDVRETQNWQARRRLSTQTPGFRVAFAFNGDGADGSDALTQAIRARPAEWHWINHTFTHEYLDPLSYDEAFDEFSENHDVARDLRLSGYDRRNVVTPGVSGLVSTEVMRAAIDAGIRFAVTDSSRAGCDNPTPNTAFYNQIAPQVLLMPRRPTNLFYNVSTPAEWTAEYNSFYAPYFGRDSTYAQVLDQESDVLLVYLLRGEIDPWMFHQANLRAYNGTRTLLGDLIDATLTKLAARLTVPVRTPAMHVIGGRFADRAALDTAGVTATLVPGRALLLNAARAVTVPVTGVRAGEAYGGDVIGSVSVLPGAPTCVALDAAGTGCSPMPTLVDTIGTASPLPVAVCDAGSGS